MVQGTLADRPRAVEARPVLELEQGFLQPRILRARAAEEEFLQVDARAEQVRVALVRPHVPHPGPAHEMLDEDVEVPQVPGDAFLQEDRLLPDLVVVPGTAGLRGAGSGA